MPPPLSSAPQRANSAFTLIELIAVMAIILILAGLILGIAGHAEYDSSLRRAQTEIKGMEAALEAYKVDNGGYPRSTATDTLNAYTDFDPAYSGGSGPKYQASSEYLYQCLTGNIPANGSTAAIQTKPYFDFKPSQLGIAHDAIGVTVATTTSPYMYVQDPFGFCYGYSTSYQAAADAASTSSNPSATPAARSGYNPTFDLWSTAGYSLASNKGTPTNNVAGDAASIYSNLWVKNW